MGVSAFQTYKPLPGLVCCKMRAVLKTKLAKMESLRIHFTFASLGNERDTKLTGQRLLLPYRPPTVGHCERPLLLT